MQIIKQELVIDIFYKILKKRNKYKSKVIFHLDNSVKKNFWSTYQIWQLLLKVSTLKSIYKIHSAIIMLTSTLSWNLKGIIKCGQFSYLQHVLYTEKGMFIFHFELKNWRHCRTGRRRTVCFQNNQDWTSINTIEKLYHSTGE